jgi:hypothetical protein
VEPQRFPFEEIPEEHRYWFLVPWGPSPREEAEREDSVLSAEVQDELEETERSIRHAKVFGVTEAEAREVVRRTMEPRKRLEEVGFAPNAMSEPWWLEIQPRWVHRQKPEYVQAPMIFTTKEKAEKVWRSLEGTDPQSYMDLMERYGWAVANTSSLRVKWIDTEMLLDKLEDSDFLCVMVDHRLKLRQDFIEELKRRLEAYEEKP